MDFAKPPAATKKRWRRRQLNCRLSWPCWSCVLSLLLDADLLWLYTMSQFSKAGNEKFYNNFCKPRKNFMNFLKKQLDFCRQPLQKQSSSYNKTLDFNRSCYSTVSPLLSPKCCIWNRLPWNSILDCGSYQTQFEVISESSTKQWICSFSTISLCFSFVAPEVITFRV